MELVRFVLQYVGWTDVLDVAAGSVLIYYVLLLIRGTRAVQILIGVLVLVGLLAIAQLLHLYLLGSILQVLGLTAVISLPIIFQPELRRALEQIGRGGLFGIDQVESARRAEDTRMSTIARVALALSRNRVGALIVIEQHSGLKEFAETGTRLDARLSGELLVTLFSPRSPLHDGAVIINKDSVEAAGCVLPLAEQSFSERRLGTRHRAALGLSEQTDAVIVVVSEETGNVCVARAGKLTRPVEDEAKLTRYLGAVTRPPRTPRARLLSQLMKPKIDNDEHTGELRA